MKCCTFCSKESQMLFTHLKHEIGLLCVECFMKLHGSCVTCGGRFIPSEIKEDVTYQIKAKFIEMGDKSIILCDYCYDAIQREFPEQMV